MATVLKTYQPQLEKEYRYWMAGADALAPGSADKRAVRWRTARCSTATGTITTPRVLSPA